MDKETKHRRCYIYTRVSTAAQTEGFSLEAQQVRLREYAAFRDLSIAGEYCDAGRSGHSTKGRPAFRQMMDDIISQKDDIACVIVFKLSRFGRNAADVLRSVQTLSDFGVDLICVDDAIDSSTQGGRLTLTILSAVAEIERENIATQFVAGRIQKIREGKWYGGPVPFGYRNVGRELVQEPYEAEIVRKIFELYMREDMKASTVATYLNETGCRRKEGISSGNLFTCDFVTNVLDNPIYCGKLVFGRRTNKKGPDGKTLLPDPGKALVSEGSHEAIVSKEEWEFVQKKRKENSGWGTKVHDPDRISLLSGLIKCPLCGAGMVAGRNLHRNKNHGGNYPIGHYYICRNYRKANGRTCSYSHMIRQEKADNAVFEIVKKVCSHPEFRKAVNQRTEGQAAAETLEEELKQKRKVYRALELEIRRLGEELDTMDITDPEYEKEYERIRKQMDSCYDREEKAEAEIRAVRNRIEASQKRTQTAETIEKMLDHFQNLYGQMSCQEKREMYRLFIDHIEVFPEPRKDKTILKSISFRFSEFYEGTSLTTPNLTENAEDICFTLDCSDLELTAGEAKATYAELKKYILDTTGLKVSSLYIAQIKRKYGLEVGEQYHKPADPTKRVPKCPPAKEAAIVEALKHFKMLDPGAYGVVGRELSAGMREEPENRIRIEDTGVDPDAMIMGVAERKAVAE